MIVIFISSLKCHSIDPLINMQVQSYSFQIEMQLSLLLIFRKNASK